MKRIARFYWQIIVLCAMIAVGTIISSNLTFAQERAVKAPAPTFFPGNNSGVTFDKDGMVKELHVRDADLRQILQMLSAQNKTNIITSKDVKGKVTVDLYGVTFSEALDAVLTSAGFGYIRKGNFIYVYTKKELEKIQASQRKLAMKIFRLNYITASDAKDLITPAMSKDGTISTTPDAKTGIPSSADEAGGNNYATSDVIVVKDYPENLEKITKIIKKVDVRPRQVLIEATILSATLTEDNALGIDLNALAGVDFRSLGYTSTDLTSITPGAVPAAQFDKASAHFKTDFASGVPQGGLSIGFVYNQIAFFIRALESVTDVGVLANPKILVMNKQRGEIMIGNKDGYLTTTVTETTSTQTVEFLETGTQLIVRPYIADDGYVRLEIHPEDSTGGITADNLPYEKTTECTSNVLVKDGHTIVISGLFSESTTVGRAQVPGLGNIPILGAVFRKRNDNTTRKEIIILITPHIIKEPIDEMVSEQYKDDIERIRVGLRQQMMWFGRSRLAQAYLQWAREHIAADRRQRALWDLNMALSLEPRMAEAIRLKERLTKQAIWANQPRYSDIKYVIQRMIMAELSHPAEKVIPPLKPAEAKELEKEIRQTLGIGKRKELPLKESVGGRKPRSKPRKTTPMPTIKINKKESKK